jgi:hypothetical protein
MTAALTPDLAVKYLTELEPALEGVVVLGSDGAVLAGDPALASSGGERVLRAYGTGYTVIARLPARPRVLDALTRHDLDLVARELG